MTQGSVPALPLLPDWLHLKLQKSKYLLPASRGTVLVAVCSWKVLEVYVGPCLNWPQPAAKNLHCCLFTPLSLLSRTPERRGRAKVRNFMGQEKDSLLDREIGEKTNDIKAATYHLIQVSQPKTPPLLPLPPFILLNMAFHHAEYAFCQFRSAVPAVSPTNSWPPYF